jgi:hypothetical protein
MLNVTFYRDSRHRLSSIFASGHADAGQYGEDIVCAAVSGILQAARLGLETYAKIDAGAQQSSGELKIRIPESARDDAAVKAIAATAELAVGQIARQYPAHVAVTQADEIG